MMAGVLVVERDATLREALEDVLEEGGYASVGVEDVDTARDALRLSPRPLIVLVSHGDPQDRGPSLVDEAGTLPRHAYLLLSTRPQAAPHPCNPHTDHEVPVVAEPFDLDTLRGELAAVAARL